MGGVEPLGNPNCPETREIVRPSKNDSINPEGKTLRETRVLLLRHAETAAPDCFHGAESDIGLGEAGLSQASTVAQRLARLRPVAVYSSGMRRARQTAEPIGRACETSPEVVEALHERRMGPLSGVRKEEGWQVYVDAMARWKAGDLGFTHEGGESYEEMASRVVPALRELAVRHEGETIAVVAHGVVIRVLLTTLLGDLGPQDFDRIGIDFVAVNDLRWDGTRWRSAGILSSD